MSTARFARSGRVRICILMSMFVVVIMMIVIYHMSQQQLDETRVFRLHCEQKQEELSLRLQSLTENKQAAEKNVELLRAEKQSIQDDYEKQQDVERTLQQKYDVQVNRYKVLEAKHNELLTESEKIKKKHIEDTTTLLEQLQKLQQNNKQQEATIWKEKYETLLKESEHKTHTLEQALEKLNAQCKSGAPAQAQTQPKQQLVKPIDSLTADTTSGRQSSPAQPAHSIEKPRNNKSFNEQVQVSQGLYRIGIAKPSQATNTTTKPHGVGTEQRLELQRQLQQQQPLQRFDVRNNHSLILNSVENFQMVPKALKTLADETNKQQQEQPELAAAGSAVSPLSAPRKSNSSTPNSEVSPNASVAPKALGSSSSGQPPLVMPPAKPSAEVKVERKLPENVAPIPDNFDGKADGAADVDTAAEELPKNENNNRYSNVVNDMETNKNQGALDSGAHEVKDALNEQNFNLPGAEHNLFDGDIAGAHGAEADNKMLAADAAAVGGGGGDDDDDVILGDVAVKQPQHLLENDNLNNEIAGDQGKEFGDAVHLDDGMDEDQDEDDYNVPARKPGADSPVRN
ncbi:PREDICTED: transcription factor SPT20 homolog isoform X1 [Drosophila arizonae]|uniref:Transcription factor SPT20 homolog isoform X1 n=1 Tax=Drosophila arizonae TaxID=7263 RepID=A0ABM1NLR0_DROAR|nr:PREDICTED: transcription factor SPT20 homolog isoform X1 [Drosophila arizonae]